MISLIDEACAAGAPLSMACDLLDLSPRTIQRWREDGGIKADGRQLAGKCHTPANKLSESEQQRILQVANYSGPHCQDKFESKLSNFIERLLAVFQSFNAKRTFDNL